MSASRRTAIARPTPNWRTLIRSLNMNGTADRDHHRGRAGGDRRGPPEPEASAAPRVAGREVLTRACQQQHLVGDRDPEDRREDADDGHRVEVAGATQERVVAPEQERHRPERGGRVRRSKATATSGRAIVCSPIISTSATASARTATTAGIFALVSFVKSVRLPAGPPTAVVLPVLAANAAAESGGRRRAPASSRVRGLLRHDHDLAGGAALVDVHRERGQVLLGGRSALDGREHEVPGVEQPRRLGLELLEVLRRRQRPAELRDAGLELAETPDELAGRADSTGDAGLQLARTAGELAEPGLERGGAGVQRTFSPAVSWPPPALSFPMPLASEELPLRSFAMPPCSWASRRRAAQTGRQCHRLLRRHGRDGRRAGELGLDAGERGLHSRGRHAPRSARSASPDSAGRSFRRHPERSCARAASTWLVVACAAPWRRSPSSRRC